MSSSAFSPGSATRERPPDSYALASFPVHSAEGVAALNRSDVDVEPDEGMMLVHGDLGCCSPASVDGEDGLVPAVPDRTAQPNG